MLYPEIYYKVQPYILSICDEMDSFGGLPTKKAISFMSDKAYEQIISAYPELRQYEENTAMSAAIAYQSAEAMQERGLFRDFLDILLIRELIGRHRW